MDPRSKLLDVVRRELNAADARIEWGGTPPSVPHQVSATLPDGWRVVVTFAEPPSDRAGVQSKLNALVGPFLEVAVSLVVPVVANPALPNAKQDELDEALDELAERTGARAAVVIDERSPMVWGCSGARASGWDLDGMRRLRALAEEMQPSGVDAIRWVADGPPPEANWAAAGIDPTVAQRWGHRAGRIASMAPEWDHGQWTEAHQIALAMGAARAACTGGRAPERFVAHDDDWGVFTKGFAQIYLLALVYDGPFSELHAEGPLVRALPVIESLVLSLPPVEPPPKSAKVISLKRPSR
ncbi:MAG: hypothetical protein AB8I08_24545 [Sandaracinaceae bacterium]